MSTEALARALEIAEVGCWANPPHHGPEQDGEVHRNDARQVAAALDADGLVIVPRSLVEDAYGLLTLNGSWTTAAALRAALEAKP